MRIHVCVRGKWIDKEISFNQGVMYHYFFKTCFREIKHFETDVIGTQDVKSPGKGTMLDAANCRI